MTTPGDRDHTSDRVQPQWVRENAGYLIASDLRIQRSPANVQQPGGLALVAVDVLEDEPNVSVFDLAKRRQ